MRICTVSELRARGALPQQGSDPLFWSLCKRDKIVAPSLKTTGTVKLVQGDGEANIHLRDM